MPLNAFPQDFLRQQQDDQLEEALATAAPPANVASATTLHDPGEVRYRGRRYRVAYLGWRDGVRLMALEFEYLQLLRHDLTEIQTLLQLRTVVAEMVTLLSAQVRPRWRYRWRAVFRDAELGELEALRHFFSPARMRSPVAGRASIRAPGWCQRMWPTGSPSSPVGIHAGWRQTAIRAATATTLSD
jgi:hypothetical protein